MQCTFSKDPECPKPPEINYGSRTFDRRRATYTCDFGYTLQGNPILTCDIKFGIWTPEPPICHDGGNNHTLSSQYFIIMLFLSILYVQERWIFEKNTFLHTIQIICNDIRYHVLHFHAYRSFGSTFISILRYL